MKWGGSNGTLMRTGQLLATEHGFKLIVRQFDGCARYLVVRTATEGDKYGDVMLASGTEFECECSNDGCAKNGQPHSTDLG